MKAFLAAALMLLPLFCLSQFTKGSIVVMRLGDGITPLFWLNGPGNPIFLDEYSSDGALIKTYPIPTQQSGVNAGVSMFVKGALAEVGILSRSANEQFLLFIGYANAQSVPPNSIHYPSDYSKTLVLIDQAGRVNSSTVITDFPYYPRGATSKDGNGFWFVGESGGIRYCGLGGNSSTIVSDSILNNRNLGIYNGQLYYSTGEIGTVGIGFPTTSGNSIHGLTGIRGDFGSINQFIFFDTSAATAGADLLYLACSLGIKKYNLIDGAWEASDSIQTPAFDFRGITGTFSEGKITLFANTRQKVYKVVDNTFYGGVGLDTTVIVTAAPSVAFAGLALSPTNSDKYLEVIYPQLTLSKSVVEVGQKQVITGKSFTSSGTVNLIVKDPVGNDLGSGSPIKCDVSGQFSFTLPVTVSSVNGEYQVYGIDFSSGKTTSTSRFKVNQPQVHKLIVKSPTTMPFTTDKSIELNWEDFIDVSSPLLQTGYTTKKYKIEISKDNGQTWIVREPNHQESRAVVGSNSNFHTTLNITVPGNYTIKITDLENSSNSNTSSVFPVSTVASGGFKTLLVWDNGSSPWKEGSPVGLAADGTCRIIVKLQRQQGNFKKVSKIDAEIIDLTGVYSTPDFLGKILPATDTTGYSLQGNSAKLAITTYQNNNNSLTGNYSFWLVAPDNFTSDLNSEHPLRNINVQFKIFYSDNSIEPVTASNIKIVRPPLFMVHGINSDPDAFKNTRYNLGNGESFFDGDGIGGKIRNPLWMEAVRVQLDKAGSFKKNAGALLGLTNIVDRSGKPIPYNSLRDILDAMHRDKFACCRVDYVCHSMGGCVARTMIDFFSQVYRPSPADKSIEYKNYDSGYINKLITINTPHDGADIADLVVDKYPNFINNLDIIGLRSFTQLLDGFFVPVGRTLRGTPIYIVSDALKDLQAGSAGFKFPTTRVKNHLIGSDIDFSNSFSESDLRLYYKNVSYDLLYSELLPFSSVPFNPIHYYTINAYMNRHYKTDEYLSNSDFMVPVSSQLPRRSDMTYIQTNPLGQSTSSIMYGPNENHSDVTDDPLVGTRIMHLLNAPINSAYFANEIDKSAVKSRGGASWRLNTAMDFGDTSIIYYDNAKTTIRILPSLEAFVDSTLEVKITIKDTTHFKKLRVVFLDQFITVDSIFGEQSFVVKVSGDYLGRNKIFCEAMYDSSGFLVEHIDTLNFDVKSLDTLKEFYLSPESQYLNSNQMFALNYNVVFNSFIGRLNSDADSVKIVISDTNVVKYDSGLRQFITKDTGTAYIIIGYNGLADTAYVYLTRRSNDRIVSTCPSSNTSLSAGNVDTTKSYQWQVDTGGGFQAVSDDKIYNGSSTPTLNLINAPSSWYGYHFRCLVSDSLGAVITPAQQLRFSSTWTGAVDSLWSNTGNWSCGILPDENTDVMILNGVPNYPALDSNANVRSLITNPSTTVKINAGYHLTVSGKND